MSCNIFKYQSTRVSNNWRGRIWTTLKWFAIISIILEFYHHLLPQNNKKETTFSVLSSFVWWCCHFTDCRFLVTLLIDFRISCTSLACKVQFLTLVVNNSSILAGRTSGVCMHKHHLLTRVCHKNRNINLAFLKPRTPARSFVLLSPSICVPTHTLHASR